MRWLGIVFVANLTLYGVEFKYQVSCDKPFVYYIHQTEPLKLELYSFNEITKEHVKLLSSFFRPAGFKLLPKKDGFSFIHNDTLYIKKFCKRSPKRIELNAPLYGITTVDWIDDETFYCAAREHGQYHIYEGTIDGESKKIISNDSTDNLFPQKIDDQLFYIQRDSHNRYCLIKTEYGALNAPHEVIYDSLNALTYLHLTSEREGFFLEYNQQLPKESDSLYFTYWYLRKEQDTWNIEKRDQGFSVPLKYLVDGSPEQAYESIVAFLQPFNKLDEN